MPKSYNFSQFQNEAKPEPFVIELDDRDNIVIEPPDADTIMDAEESGSTRKFLEILCGDAYPEVDELVGNLSSRGLVQFVRTMTKHFGISSEQVPDEGKRRK